MLLYEYPHHMDRQARQVKAINDLNEHKKMQKNVYKNLLLGALIIVIGFLASITVIKVVLWLIGVGNIITALLLYNVSSLSKDPKAYTKIYDDKLEHCQAGILFKKHTYITLYYDDAIRSYQNNRGELIVELKDNYRSEVYIEDKNGKHKISPENNQLTIRFQDTQAKLYLINNLYEKINYPHKEYNIIEDEEDEDDKWDPLHKHGL